MVFQLPPDGAEQRSVERRSPQQRIEVRRLPNEEEHGETAEEIEREDTLGKHSCRLEVGVHSVHPVHELSVGGIPAAILLEVRGKSWGPAALPV